MGIMNTVMDILRTLLIPVVAVVLAVVIFNMMKAPGKTTTSDDTHFKVTEGRFWLIIIAASALAGIGLIWRGTSYDQMSNMVVACIFGGFCLAITIAVLFIYFRRHLDVDGDMLCYQPIWGKAETFNAKTIGRLDVVTTPRYDEYRFYNRSGKEMFIVQGYMINASLLLKFIKKYPVKVANKKEEK